MLKFIVGLFTLPKFNIGKDLTIVCQVNGVVIKQFGLHESVAIKSDWTMESSEPINYGGLTIKRAIFGGYTVDIKTSRVNSVVDDLQQFLADNYLAGNPDPVVTMTQTVINTADNTVNQYQYLDGTIIVDDSGNYANKAKVGEGVQIFFPRRVTIASNPAITLGGGLIPTGAAGL